MSYREVSREKTSPGRRIKELLKESGMTQVELSEKLGVSVQSVSSWVTDKSLPNKKKKELSELFGVDVDYIMCNQPERVKNRPNFNSIEPSKEELMKIRDHIDMYDALITLLNLQGYDLLEGQAEVVPDGEIIKYMESDSVVTAVIDSVIGIKTYKIYYPDGSLLEISADKLDLCVKSIMDYIGFTMQQLKDNNSSGS